MPRGKIGSTFVRFGAALGIAANDGVEALDFGALRALQAELNDAVATTSRALNKFSGGAMGLTPDAVKNSPDFRVAKDEFDIAFQRLRTFNKTYGKELRAARLAKG